MITVPRRSGCPPARGAALPDRSVMVMVSPFVAEADATTLGRTRSHPRRANCASPRRGHGQNCVTAPCSGPPRACERWGAGGSLNEAVVVGVGGRRRPRGDGELGVDVGEVAGHRLLAQVQFP